MTIVLMRRIMGKRRFFVLLMALIPLLAFADDGVDIDNNIVRLAMTQEPPTLNSIVATDSVSFWVLSHVTEGLMDYDKAGMLTGAVAESWSLSDSHARFRLRKDARWSDGKAVTARDFIFAWQQVLEARNASQYAFILYPIKNAEAVNLGQKPMSALGVKAVDDWTLEVELEKPCPYFLELTAFASYRPIREDVYARFGEAYAADADKMLFNGPFTLDSWVHGASLSMRKNPRYWDAEQIKLGGIDVPYITTDTNALFSLFKDKKIAITTLTPATISQALKQRMFIQKFVDGSLFFLEFNFRPGHITANKNFRKAIQAVFDTRQFTNKVIAVPGNEPAYSLFPRWVMGDGQALSKQYPATATQPDIKKAQAYLLKAKAELGVEKLPPIVLLAGDTPSSSKQAEYIQNLLLTTLGIEVKIDQQIFKQRLAKMTNGEFDIVAAAWGPDYNDGMTFADLFSSWNENNRGRYRSERYDYWVNVAQNSSDAKVRAEAFAEIQAIVHDDVVILPQYERGFVYVQSPQLKGVVRRVFGGDPAFKFAWLEAQ